jgi:hypothetical protein
MLASMLDSHPKVRCHGEVLGGGGGQVGDRLVGVDYEANPGLRERLVAMRDRDPVEFLREWVYTVDAEGAAGFKIKYEELLKPDFASVLSWLVNDRSIHVVHLVRRNRLKRLVSQITAIRIYGAFQITDPKQRPPAPRFRLSADECLADFERQERREGRFGRLFKTHEVFDTSYEDLMEPGGSTLREIQRFLGVDPVELRTWTRKMNPEELSDVLENYAELREAFSDTRYAAYFED